VLFRSPQNPKTPFIDEYFLNTYSNYNISRSNINLNESYYYDEKIDFIRDIVCSLL
jgi:hypothetical protein